jgi:hypothetical protein
MLRGGKVVLETTRSADKRQTGSQFIQIVLEIAGFPWFLLDFGILKCPHHGL